MRGLLQRVADMIAQYLPLCELRIVAFVREHSIVTYCERRWKYAYFYRRGLISIRPIVLHSFRNVTELNLNGNQFQSVPDTIGNCVQLKLLYLCENRLQSVPDTIDKCTQLQCLCLRKNPIARRPVLNAKVQVYY